MIIPPIRNVTFFGAKLMNAFTGETTFAAMLVERVATVSAKSAMMIANPPPISPNSSVGSEIARPYMTTVAEVTATPINAKSVMKVGSPIACPRI